MDDWTDAVRAAHVGVAVAAFALRLFERHRASPELQALARKNLSEALDELEAQAPGLFAAYASEDAAWMDDLREHGLLPGDWSEED
jgi:hypothetical protein